MSPQMLVSSTCGIVMCNMQGLQTYRRKYKVNLLREKAIEENIAIIAMVEIHLRKEISDAEVKMDGFQLHRADRKDGFMKGGVGVYIRLRPGTNGYCNGGRLKWSC